MLAARNIKSRNNKKMNFILDIAVEKIMEQGCGCFVTATGVAYIDYKSGYRDSIGILLKRSDLAGHSSWIASETSKPLVAKLRTKFGIDISMQSENDRFVKFLTKLQDAHDDNFCEFNREHVSLRPKDLMNAFLFDCENIRGTIND